MERGFVIIFALILINSASALVIDHNSALEFDSITADDLALARANLHIVYIHTSHGSHITSGMKAIASKYGTKYAYANADNQNYLDINDKNANFGECNDLSQCDADSNGDGYAKWYELTSDYLNYNPNTNVVFWSWCSINGHDAQMYIDTMEKMISNYPEILFVFITGHAEGQGEDLTENSVHYNNQLIRAHIASNDRILFDFADIEGYDPDGNYYWNQDMQDDLGYSGGNWGIDWITSNPKNEITDLASRIDYCAHSDNQPEMKINCALKGLAVWSLWANLAKLIDQIEELTCIEDWFCSTWGDCITSSQIRTCSDLNFCGTQVDKPIETQNCIVDTMNNLTESINETNTSIIDENTTIGEDEVVPEIIKEEALNKISLVSDNGKIHFKEDVIIADSLSISGKVIIKHNKIYIDSNALPEFNVSARLELTNITFNNPRILRNGEPCPELICTLIEYENNRLVFDVTSFSEYSSEETPICGDEICHKEESCELCAVDCGECFQLFSSENESESKVKKITEAYLTEKKGGIAIIIVFLLIILFSCVLIVAKLIQQIKKRKKKYQSLESESPKSLAELKKSEKNQEKPKKAVRKNIKK